MELRNNWQYDPSSYPVAFLGVRATQVWGDLYLWEQFLNEHQDVRGLCELGTGDGGLFVYLALQCTQRRMQYMSLDNQKWLDMSLPIPALLNIGAHFVHADLWDAKTGDAAVRAFIARDDVHPLVLWCDDGDKPREWRTFGPLLRPGDYIAVHDWGTEFKEKDTAGVKVTPIMRELCAQRGSMTRWWQVTA